MRKRYPKVERLLVLDHQRQHTQKRIDMMVSRQAIIAPASDLGLTRIQRRTPGAKHNLIDG